MNKLSDNPELKGDIVKFEYYVKGHTVQGERNIHRYRNWRSKTILGIFLGWSYIAEGNIVSEDYWDNYLKETKRRRVAVVEPLTNGNRYNAPVRVLESDLLVQEEKNEQSI